MSLLLVTIGADIELRYRYQRAVSKLAANNVVSGAPQRTSWALDADRVRSTN